jgi:hypothetical protein
VKPYRAVLALAFFAFAVNPLAHLAAGLAQ